MMVIFPFEAPFYQNRGVDAEFVGHPLAYLPTTASNREDFAVEYGLRLKTEISEPQKIEWIALLPGSRWKEVQSNLPTMLKAAEILGGNYGFLLPVASTLDIQQVQRLIEQLNKDGHSATPPITLVTDAREALHHAQAAIVASGTATVQAAVIGNPFVVVYRVSPLTFAAAKRLIRYPAEIPAQPDAHGNLPIAMVNLIAGRRVVPELIQDQFTATNVAEALRPLLADTPERAQMVADLAEVRHRLTPGTPLTPIQQVADAVEALLHQPATSGGRIPTASV